LVELQRVRARVDAVEARLLAALVEPGDAPGRLPAPPGVSAAAVAAKQYVREEIACALQVAPVTVNDRLHQARRLVADFPATLAALEAGQVTMRHARILVEGCDPLPAEAAGRVEARVLGKVLARAAAQTPTAFRRSVARAVAAVDPRGAEQRHEDARAERAVSTRLLPDAMGALYATISAPDLQAVREVVQAAADAHPEHHPHCRPIPDQVAGATAARRAVPRRPVGCADPECPTCAGPGCPGCVSRARSADQRRADAFVALLLGVDTPTVLSRHGRRPAVQVSVGLSTGGVRSSV
ncbi:DUF222 domain-containing protein, partial [Jatrophihabitans endophyticus]|uniref:DUF222 domain-containing protein n=1 Tax=Jatrophihabitans endophyticus TaxID=1206085 RepID=UPI0019E6E142